MSDTPRPRPTDWEARWQAGDAPWDLGRAPPALEALAASCPAPLRVFVPGAGRGHDAVAWARHGHGVTALDIAPTAVAEGRALAAEAGVEIEWLCGDLFDLPGHLHRQYDVVWEQTCFCAIEPARRPDYVAAVASLLGEGGTLRALLWNHGKGGGPPFDVAPEHARSALAAHFLVQRIDEVARWTAVRWDEFLVTAEVLPA